MNSALALVVMSRGSRQPLLKDLKPLGVDVIAVGSCREARRLLDTQPPVDVVITQVSLPDGNWCDIFKYLVDNGVDANLLVSSRQADEILWSEVLWRGAYDLLVEPYEEGEVRRAVEGALRSARRPTARRRQAAAAGGGLAG